MWIMTNVGFISAVDKAKNRRRDLHVRSRRKEHLMAIFPHLRSTDIEETMGGDYRFRADIPRAKVASVIGAMLAGVTYNNFKDSVADNALHDAYAGVWTVMGKLQDGGPYNWGARTSRYSSGTLFDTFDDAPDEDEGSLRECSGAHVCEGCMDEPATWAVHGQNLCGTCVLEHYGEHGKASAAAVAAE